MLASNRLTIQNRLKLLLCLPLLFLAAILGKDSYDEYGSLRKAEASREIVRLASLTADIAHRLQEERNLTDGYLGNRAEKSREQLSAKRAESDQRIRELQVFLRDSEATAQVEDLARKIEETNASLAGLDRIRQRVDGGSIQSGEAFAFYSGVLAETRSSLRLISQVVPDQELMRLVAAHYNFLELIMRLHGERLLLANTFANNEFAVLMFMRFAEGLAEQKVYTENFLTLVNAEIRDFYRGKIQDPSFNQVEAMRQVAIDRRFGGGFNLDPEQWRRAMSSFIAAMNEVESRLTTHYLTEADSHHSSSLAKLTTRSGIGLLVFLVSLGIAAFLSRGLVRSLIRISSEVHEGTMQISSAAHQLAATSEMVADSSSRQAASLEETSASTEEMSAMIKRDAENASQADTLMQEAGRVLSAADGSMKRLTGSMAEIESASLQTQKIVRTIDEIAFQTNLLALNAAVEAARAGEAGAGFAVVADEVRNLAMRAAEAAKSTSALIDGTVQKVAAGTSLVAETERSFEAGRTAVEKIAVLLTELATASREEASAVHQLNEAISLIDQGTQENAASAEELASAAEELSSQAKTIQQKVIDLLAMTGRTALNDPDRKSLGDWPPGSRSAPPAAAARSKKAAAPSVASRKLPSSASPARPKTTRPAEAASPALTGRKDPAAVIPFDKDEFEDF